MKSFRFPWLLSNVLDARTGQPLGGAHSSRIVEWQGVRVGLMGLVEREVSARKGLVAACKQGLQLRALAGGCGSGVFGQRQAFMHGHGGPQGRFGV